MDDAQTMCVVNHIHKARCFLKDGNPKQALHELMSAIRLTGVDDINSTNLHNAGQILNGYQDQEELNQQVQAVTRLLGEVTMSTGVAQHDFSKTILAESGRELMNAYALEDGSCYQCVVCGDVIVSSRKEAHELYWCRGSLSVGDKSQYH